MTMHQNRGPHPRGLLTAFRLIAAGCLILPPLFIALAWSTRVWLTTGAHELLADQAYEPAIDELDRAVRLDPSLAVGPRFAVAYHARGLARLGKNQYDGAIADLTRIVDLSKPVPDPYRRDLAPALTASVLTGGWTIRRMSKRLTTLATPPNSIQPLQLTPNSPAFPVLVALPYSRRRSTTRRLRA